MLHRLFQEYANKSLFTHAMARVFGIGVPEPVPGGVTVLSADLTETDPLERRADSVLQVQFLVEDPTGKYILVLESQTEPERERRLRWPHFISHLQVILSFRVSRVCDMRRPVVDSVADGTHAA